MCDGMNRTVAFHEFGFLEALGVVGFVAGFAVVVFLGVCSLVLCLGGDIEESGWPALRAGKIAAVLWVAASLYLILKFGVF